MRSLVALLVLLPSLLAAADAWPHRHGPAGAHGSVEATPAWLAEPTVIWRAEVGAGFSGVTVAKGKLLTMSRGKSVHRVICLDSATGEELWHHDLPIARENKRYPGPASTPTVAGDLVYVTSRAGILAALALQDGTERWRRDLPAEEGITINRWGLTSSCLVRDGRLYVNAGTEGACFDATTGEPVFINGKDDHGLGDPVLLDDGRLVVFSRDGVVGVDSEGSVTWRVPWTTKYGNNLPTPLPVPGGVIVTSGYGVGMGFVALADGKATLAWTTKEVEHLATPPVRRDGNLYGIDFDSRKTGELYCLGLEDGAVAWRGPACGSGGLIRVGGTLVILTGDGQLVLAAADPTGYTEQARLRVVEGPCWLGPSYAGGFVYAKDTKGKLACVKVTE